MKNKINWKLYFILLAVSVIAISASIPYAFTLASETIKQAPVSLPVLVIISIVQSSILFAIVLFLGLKLSQKVGLGLPILTPYLSKEKPNIDIKALLKLSILLGIAVGLAIILLDLIFTKFGVGINFWTGSMPPFWMGLLISFYGGIGEEILLRLFFMSFLIWLFNKFRKSKDNVLKNNFLVWSAIILSTILFGLGHLPITASVTNLTPLVISRAILLNGVGGMVFGWLYWKKGLESAIVAHFSADIILHVFFPLIVSII